MTKSEAQTRSEIIDQQLALSGWNVNDPTQVAKEFDILIELAGPRALFNGHQFSDYVLLGKDGRPLAVVEAKKSSRDAAIGREQAKQYSYNIQKQVGGELPFCFYTNGLEIYFWDLENAPPRKVVGFPSRDDLERFAYIRRNRKPLTQEFINTSIAGRDYQIRAIRSVLEGIEQKKRNFLLVMATGTGKTRTCIAMVDALMRASYAEKTLFLVDRIALREEVKAIYQLFALLSSQEIDQFKSWYQANNDIESACANDTATQLVRYADIPAAYNDLSDRLRAKILGENESKYWITQVLDEWKEEGKSPDDFLRTLARQTLKNPLAEANFLKMPFLEACRTKGVFDAADPM
ncbi:MULTISPECIES: DEAD/DEAH box helicase family protein [Bradyrhizobium]|jgi:type I site-specific restriction endonuclease|uniref:Type I site-specific restriction endonuclease n=1 Tax=Bradyrhizobium elkanii TaxID=29448 RepID=A0A8I1Y934_BRAEL|nr:MULTISPECIES: DEAD/DEAH box helicase family protein [Bradyrhizobium]MBP1292293.1 type I site-specific restriction endonuclease [Bradyrhizobium elkanii]MCP1927210.1 type I site-specific restriction endonuclease [Bradyrhizobium elkanii]MCS3475272.1 type I site-specific restriction endonuclease [Bradyrhizobium elkanii]MCS3582116.1 type I site-specific restriction endonuclease [Bradyrhizobium elkanii]MCS3715683.1 type I site-specific restriction endonuclease [Bradyrhizobium elkanii]